MYYVIYEYVSKLSMERYLQKNICFSRKMKRHQVNPDSTEEAISMNDSSQEKIMP